MPMPKKIDIHVHTMAYKGLERFGGGTYASPEEIREIYSQIGVSKGVILPGVNPDCAFQVQSDVTGENRNGYPKGPVKPGRVVELMRKYPNLCGDLSARSGYNAVTRDPDFGYAFIEEFQDRLYYGTDICDPRNITNPMLKLSSWLDEAAEKGKISETAYRKVSYENALELLEG